MEQTFILNGSSIKVSDYKKTSESVSFILNGKSYLFNLIQQEGPELILENGERFKAAVSSLNSDGESIVICNGREALVSTSGKKKKSARVHAGGLSAPMPGKIFKILKEAGSDVKKGEPVLILEAMKMEHSIRSDKDGKVKKVFFKVGDLVQNGVLLAEVE